MAKKDFSGGFKKILGDNNKETTAQEKLEAKKIAEEKTAKQKKIEEAKINAKIRLEKRKAGRPKDPTKRVPTKSSQEGTKNNETRATFIVNEDLLEKLKNVAYWDRKKIKEVIGEALSEYIANREEKKGEVKQRPL